MHGAAITNSTHRLRVELSEEEDGDRSHFSKFLETCSRCGQAGHGGDACPNKPPDQNSRNEIKGGDKCRHCLKPGHQARACPEKEKEERIAAG